MSDLYDADIESWSERQAELLRRVAAGERVNDQVDWRNVIDEVESAGRSERRSCESLLIQAFRHRLKIMAWPDSPEVPHWQEEVTIFQMDAARAFQEAMRGRPAGYLAVPGRLRHVMAGPADGAPPRVTRSGTRSRRMDRTGSGQPHGCAFPQSRDGGQWCG